jgi:flagellin-like hook-associated protein FlgL
VADSALDQIGQVLDDVQGSLVTAANTATTSDAEAQYQQQAVAGALESIQRITASAQLGSRNVFDGPLGLGLAPQDESVLSNVRSQLGLAAANLTAALDEGDLPAAAQQAADARAAVSTARARVGAIHKYAVETQAQVLSTGLLQLFQTRSQLADADFAFEASLRSGLEILERSGTAVLKAAIDHPRSVLVLFA